MHEVHLVGLDRLDEKVVFPGDDAIAQEVSPPAQLAPGVRDQDRGGEDNLERP
jgi:hypothetical protein